jgi:hypothetical protein
MALERLGGGGGGGLEFGGEARGLFLFPASFAAGLGVCIVSKVPNKEFISEGSPWSLNSHSFFSQFSCIILPPFQNIRCFSFVKQMYLDIF